MEFVLHIVLALLSVGAADVGLAGGAERPLFVAALVAVPHVLAGLARGAQYRGRFRMAVVLERLVALAPFAAQLAAVGTLGWLATVGSWTGRTPTLSAWPGLELLLGIAPFVATQLAALHARTVLRDPRRSDRRALFLFQARMFLSGLAPFVVYVALSAVLGTRDGLRVRLEEVSLYSTLFTLALLGVFLGFLPLLLRNTWKTTPLPGGELRGQLEEVAARSGFAFRELLQWNTGGQMANAAIVGFTPRTRVVLFTDALLQQLQPRELAAVFAHEIGHARRHHASTFVVFVVIVFVGAQVALDLGAIESEWVALAVFGGLFGLWLVAFGWLSRRFELDADLASLEVIGDPLPLASALVRVTGAHAHERDGWRHFSTARRVRFLAAAAADPAVGQRLRRRLRAWSRGGTLIALGLISFWGLRLFELRPEEELVADLRLGAWARAAERVDGGVEVDPGLAALVERARGLEPGLEPDALEEAALLRAEAGDLVGAHELLDLAGLRGAPDVGPRLALLEALTAPADAASLDASERAALREGLAPRWRALLREAPAPGGGPPRRGAMLGR